MTSSFTLPATMRAATQLAYGITKESIVVQEVPTPVLDPASDHVLIRVHLASINAGDIRVARGDIKLVMGRTFPHVLGMDVAGTIVAVGAKCQKLKVGDEVFGDMGERGTMAEYVCAPETQLVVKPKNVSFEEAAAVPVAAVTAYQALKKHVNLASGQRILILGGSGGVGSFAVQIAKSMGAYVCATSSNVSLLKDIGADRAINYTEEKWWEVLKGENYDALVDCVGEGWAHAPDVLKKGGRFCPVSAGDQYDGVLTIGTLVHMISFMAIRSVTSALGLSPSYAPYLTDPSDITSLQALAGLLGEKKIKAVYDPVGFYELTTESVLAMFEYMNSGRVKGKLVLKVM